MLDRIRGKDVEAVSVLATDLATPVTYDLELGVAQRTTQLLIEVASLELAQTNASLEDVEDVRKQFMLGHRIFR